MKSPYHTRPRFSYLVSALLALAIGTAVMLVMNRGMNKLPIRQYFPQDQVNAIWDWSNIARHSDSDLRDTAQFLYIHQINTIYVDIGAYADAISNPAAVHRNQQLQQLNSALQRYVAAMSAQHIRVFAAAGNTDWSKPNQQAIPLAIQQYVFSYNHSHHSALAGLEYDVEAYNQTNFDKASFTEKGLVLDEYLDMVDRLATAQASYDKQSAAGGFELGFAIPYWFDNENKNIQSVAWHDKTGPVLYHLFDRLNVLPASNVDVMDYRNAALGNDGMIYHARTEVDYATTQAKRVKVLIGMEMNDVQPAKITFYGQSYTQVSSQAKLLTSEFGSQSAFKGIAINDLNGYRGADGRNGVGL